MSSLLRWLSPLLVALALCISPARAQAEKRAEESGRNPPAPQFALLVLTAMGVMVILCMPSRKRTPTT